jgi:pimeloyl-ACP methyl ester carboxylesterase
VIRAAHGFLHGDAEAIAREVPDAWLTTIVGAGHLAHRERPDELAHLVMSLVLPVEL